MYVWITLHAHHSGDDKLESSETGGKKREKLPKVISLVGSSLHRLVTSMKLLKSDTVNIKKCIFFHKELGSKYVLKYFYVLILHLYLRAYIIYTYIIFC